jgi:hypothetical protein
VTEIERINSNGLARGWHAQQLQAHAKRTGRTMASLHVESTRNASAFSVPAEATHIKGGFVYYQFMDGSVVAHVHQKRERT